MSKPYSEKLKDPRWQRKRLEVLNRDNFTCTKCGYEKSTLHVHHLEYFGNPWDVPLDKLITTCEKCHSVIEFIVPLFKQDDITLNVISIENRKSGYSLILGDAPERQVIVISCFENGIYDYKVRFDKETVAGILKKFD